MEERLATAPVNVFFLEAFFLSFGEREGEAERGRGGGGSSKWRYGMGCSVLLAGKAWGVGCVGGASLTRARASAFTATTSRRVLRTKTKMRPTAGTEPPAGERSIKHTVALRVANVRITVRSALQRAVV